MNGRVASVGSLAPADEAAWYALAERAVQPNPLFEADTLVPAAAHLTNGPDISLVIAEEDGRFHAAFPLQPATAGYHSLRSLRRALLTTQVRRMQYDGTPLVDGDRAVDAMAAALSALRERSRTGGPGLAVFEWLDDGPVADAVRRAAGRLRMATYEHSSWERPIVRRRAEATYRSIHGGKFLRNLARLRRNLAAALDTEVRLVDRSADPAGVEEVIRLEAAGYKTQTGVAMELHRGETDWFRAMCDRFRKSDRLHLYTLEAGGTVCAVQLLLAGGDGLFLLKLAYDEQFSRFRPGLQLHLDVIDRVHDATDANWLDTCTYEGNETLLRMYPDRRRVGTLFVAVGGPADRAALRTFATLRDLAMPGSALRTRHRYLDRTARLLAPPARQLAARLGSDRSAGS